MLPMKSLVFVSLLLIGIVCTAQTKSQCRVLVKVDSVMYADTEEEKIDSVTVCDDGKATAFHTFTEPALGGTPAQRRKWDYSAEIDKDTISDLQRFIRRKDIVELYDRMKIVKTGAALYAETHFHMVDQGKDRTITFEVPLFACTDEHPEFPRGVLDLMCVFHDLYDRVKTGVSPETDCGCKSLHVLAVSP